MALKDNTTRARQHRIAKKFQATVLRAQGVFGDDFGPLMAVVAANSERNRAGYFTYPGMANATTMLEAACHEKEGKE